MRGGARATLVWAVLLAAGAAFASDRSERLYSRGLVDFNSGHYQEALAHFQSAVEADPEDGIALYYRGVTLSRLRQFQGAITDLEAALARRPDLSDAALELGVALIETGRHEEAVPWLERARASKELDPQASLFLGVALLRIGKYDAAEENLERAAAGNPDLHVASSYYQGIIAYQSSDWEKAEEKFAAVVQANPTSEMGREATDFMNAAHARIGERYRIFGALAFEYDTNVKLAPDNDVLKGVDPNGAGERADGRITVNAGGSFVPWRRQNALLSVGYEFFQSFHFNLTDFNLQDHRPSAQIIARAGNLRFGLLARYDYYRLKDSNFLQEVAGSPWVSILEGDTGQLELSYRVRLRDFLDDDFSIRNAVNHAPGIRQVIALGGDGDRYAAFGYRYDREDPTHSNDPSQAFAYDGHEVSAEVGWSFPAAIRTQLSYAFRRELYDSESRTPTGAGTAVAPLRQDSEHLLVFLASKALTDQVRVTCAYYGDFNGSTQDLFEYTRHIGSVGLEVRF